MVNMDYLYVAPYKPDPCLIASVPSYGDILAFDDFDFIPSPSQLEALPEYFAFNQHHFDQTDLFRELTTASLLPQDLLHTEEEQNLVVPSMEKSIIETPQQAQSTDVELEILSPNTLQARRKLQNRAAQRAFRIRRELLNKDLQAKNMLLEKQAISMADEHARLKKKLAHTKATNMILQARLRVHAIDNSFPSPSP